MKLEKGIEPAQSRLPIAPAKPATPSRSGHDGQIRTRRYGAGGRTVRVGGDVEIEDLGRDGQSGASVGNIDDAADPAFNRGGAQDGVRLSARVAELLQVLDRIQAGAPVGDVHVQVMLRTAFIDRDAFE